MIKESNTTNFRQSLGKIGEAITSEFLISSGWTVEARNFYAHRQGEIDIIARPPGAQALVFVEVKTRRVRAMTGGLDHPGQLSVHPAKQNRIRRAALTYVSDRAILHTRAPVLRFDLTLVDIKLNYCDLREL